MAGSFNKLRKKPKHVRDNIAFGVAGGFTLTLAIAWFLIGFGNGPTSPEVTSEEKNGAFSTLFDQIQEQVATAKEGVIEGNEASSTMPSVTGEWGISAQNASSTSNGTPREAAIMVVGASSSARTSSSTASTSVLY